MIPVNFLCYKNINVRYCHNCSILLVVFLALLLIVVDYFIVSINDVLVRGFFR